MDHTEQLRRTRSEFERRAVPVRTGHMALPTPAPSDRPATAGTRHRSAPCLRCFSPRSSAEQCRALITAFEVGGDPRKRFRGSAAEVIAAFGEPRRLERTVQHPVDD
jgi:hypothetical protein